MSSSRNGVYKRPNSPNYFFRLKDEQGKWIERSSGTSDYAEAKKKKALAEREVEEGCLPNDRSSWSLEAAVEAWLKDRKVRVSSGTYASDVTNTRHLKAVFGEDTKLIRLAELRAIKHYQTQRLEGGLCPKTINNEVLALSAILQDANLWHRVVSRYRPLKVRPSEVGIALTREQEMKLLIIAQNSELSAVAPYVAVLALRTGMRVKEIRNLRLSAIRLTADNPHILVHRTTTKTDAGSRHVALGQLAIWALRRLIARACSLGATEANHYLLPTLLDMHTRKTDPLHGGSGYDPTHPMSAWDKEWEVLRKAAGLGTARFHDLRHTYVTRAAEAGVPLPVIQAQVGHLSAAMTAHYTHISAAAIHKAAKQIEANSQELLQQMAKHEAFQKQIGGFV
jgi:integrase